jgi:hypothetical protein
MKTLSNQQHHRWTGLIAVALLMLAGLATVSRATGDSTVGSLPSADGGDGNQSLYISGPRALVMDAIVDAWGTGYYVAVTLPDQSLWIEFYGDVCVTLDEALLEANSSLKVGMSAGFIGGGMTLVPEIDGDFSGQNIFVGVGDSWGTPYGRLEPLLGGSLVFYSTQAVTGLRAEIAYSSAGGTLMICQNIN